MTDDPYHLDRFHRAQEQDWPRARAELLAGRKTSHWMWYVFPQLAGLGRSATAQHYAISGLDEARAYLSDPMLGRRLREAAGIVAASPTPTAEALMGGIDATKLRSSVTLFSRAGGGEVFDEVLRRYFDAVPDRATLDLLGDAG